MAVLPLASYAPPAPQVRERAAISAGEETRLRRTAGWKGTPGGGMGFLRADCGSGAGAECAGLCLPGRSENLSPGSGGGVAADAGVSGGDFFRHCPLCVVPVPAAAGHRRELPHPAGMPPGNRRLLRFDLCPAVGDESGDSDGAGAGEQLWLHGDGGVCGGGENRRFCLYARAGFRKRLFHLHCPELRRGEGRPASGRS